MGKNIIKENRKIGLKEHAINSTFVAYNICNISFEKYDIQITLKLIKQRHVPAKKRKNSLKLKYSLRI